MQKSSVWVLSLTLLAGPAWVSAELTALPNGDQYEGEVTDGVLNGPGVYLWADGDRYEGTFANALPHGSGTYTWVDGRQYVGAFVDGKRQGQGTLTWPNGDRFDGSFVNNQRQGSGLMTWHSGERYRGDFHANTMHGQGDYRWPDGTRHIGAFNRDQRSGLGIMLGADGTSWAGVFAQGEPNGAGILRQSSGAMMLQRRESGILLEQMPVADNPRCRIAQVASGWMVQADGCIDGLAHGEGMAVSLAGDQMIADGKWVLGVLVQGKIESLPTPPETTGPGNSSNEVDD